MVEPLRPYQADAIQKFFAQPRKRLILAHSTGAGKSRVALEIAKQLGAKKVLVVGSAQARPVWPRQAREWWPEADFRGVRFGPENKSLTKKQLVEREEAYAAPQQVASYALLKHLDASDLDLIIFDEAHALRDPFSQQSDRVKQFMRAHPKLPALMLTATPIPTEVQNIWNLVDTLFPGYLGKESKSGDVAWSFKEKYCQKELREWDGGSATAYFGAKQEMLPELARRLEPIMHRVSSAEVAKYAPPLVPDILWVDEPKKKDAAVATEWLEARDADDSTHVGLFAWEHETAYQLEAAAQKAGWPTKVITGTMHPEQRAHTLEQLAAEPRMCLVGTAGSFAESISLSFIKQALVFEWRSSPGQAVQFMGRFARSDSKSQEPTYLLYVAREKDTEAAERLRERLTAESMLYQQDERAKQLSDVMAPRILTEERMKVLSNNTFSEIRLSLGGIIEDDDED